MNQSSTDPTGASPGDRQPPDPTPRAQGGKWRGVLAEDLLLAQLWRCSIPLILILLVGVVRGARDGFSSPQALVLLIGALVSVVATFLYALPTVLRSYGRRQQAWMRLSVVGGIVAYAFGLFVILVPGLWDQVRAPSLGGAGLGLFFLLTGFWYLRSLGRVAELAKRIDGTLASEADPEPEPATPS